MAGSLFHDSIPVLAPPGHVSLAWPSWPATSRSESWPARWSRRTLSFGVLGAGWLLALASLLVLPLVALVDAARRQRLARARGQLAVFLYLTWEVLGLLASGVLWLLKPLGSASRWVGWNARLQRRWVRTLLGSLRALYGLRITIEGDDQLVDAGPLLVLSRHTSLIDTLLPLLVLDGWRLRFVLKRELLWDPCLDVVGQRIPNAFVRRGSGSAAAEARKIQDLVGDLRQGEGAVLFPEGTRFTPGKRERVLAGLARKGAQDALARAQALRHVLPPRMAGAQALLRGCPQGGVLLVAHTGLERAGTLASLTNGSLIGERVRVRVRYVAANQVPRQPELLERWLWEAWAEMDAWLERAQAS